MIKLTNPFVGKPIYVQEKDVDRYLANGFVREVVPVVKPVKKPVKKK